MVAAEVKMEAQLKRWKLKIQSLAEGALMARAGAGFDTIMYIDELKVLYEIAQSRFDTLKTAGESERPQLEGPAKRSYDKLDAAMKHRKLWP